jgi:hypothetical protein
MLAPSRNHWVDLEVTPGGAPTISPADSPTNAGGFLILSVPLTAGRADEEVIDGQHGADQRDIRIHMHIDRFD